MAPRLNRAEQLADLAADPRFDAVVIGGGIAGAATFRDLALQGLRVALIERNDFASGASGALTRVAQGGFRYLERGDVKLVRKAVRDRNLFIGNAPHQVRPVRVVIPTESWLSGAIAAPLRFLKLIGGKTQPGAAVLLLGVKLYEFLSRRTTPANPSSPLPSGGVFGKAVLQRRYPGIATSFVGAAHEFEGLIAAPERIAIELIEDGLTASPRSVALNYVEAERVEAGRIVARDRKTDADRLDLEAPLAINAAGALVDRVHGLFGLDTRLVDGVAGTHLLLEAPDLARALGPDILFFEDAEPVKSKRRLCVTYAIGENVLLGATEVPVADPDSARTAPAEEAYLLSAINRLFPSLLVTDRQIVRRLNGVRPLLHSDADVNGRSRDHAIGEHQSASFGGPVISILGGKWTTFRTIAADATDAALHHLRRRRLVATDHVSIGGAQGLPADETGRALFIQEIAAKFGLRDSLVASLVVRYGARAARVAAYVAREPGVSHIRGISLGEQRFLTEEEMATGAEDILFRRTDLFLRTGLD
ncbi:FAD-dependent oxidoreductase [Oryzibacter oryziterrae]|uniref:FAD-dependent oxidoreductase n=1 Tax=Oryzibacter oryziterrae TaxID=2766474 RepID=UPI001F298E0F|nr:FAD-dependent oxidoreductase [Oryzibacter oryziterrae]